MTIFDADSDDLIEASRVAERFKMQFYDTLLCLLAAKAGVSHLLSEDMHDGLIMSGLSIVDPFAADNRDRVDALI